MRSFPDRDSDLDANNRWVIDKLMDLTEEVVCGSWDSELDSPGTEESMRRVQMAVERGDGKAEEEAIVEGIRADMRNWLRKFPERELLTRLFLRAVRRREKSGSPDSKRLPRRSEALPLATALLSDVQGRARLDPAWEAAAVAMVLTRQWLLARSRATLREYIRRSLKSSVYYIALGMIQYELEFRRETVPSYLRKFCQEADRGHRKPPALMLIAAHRPINLTVFIRHFRIHFAIELLNRLGVRPRGKNLAGCGVVAEVLGLSEDTIEDIWKDRIWEKPFEPVVTHYGKPLRDRYGPFHVTRA